MAESSKPRESNARRICRMVFYVVTAAFCLAALVIVAGGVAGSSLAPEGLSAVFLIVIGLPWSLLLATAAFSDLPSILARAALLVFPLVNLALLWRLCRPRRRRRRG